MKDFRSVPYDLAQTGREIQEFRTLLAGHAELEENKDLKPFFEASPHLSTLLGSYLMGLGWFDLVAYQYQLFGDFTCDLVVGDSRRKTYVLVELEDATGGSLFAPQGKEATPEWSRRSERGVSQLMDWFWKLDDMARTAEFETRFGHRQITVGCLLLIGRGAMLSHPRERKRWEWRRLKVLVNSHKVYHETTDDLCTNLQEWLTVLEAQTPGPGPAVPRS